MIGLTSRLKEGRRGMGYHHGDLRTALVDAGIALIAEGGLSALSVAEAARRTGVSAAAPYRHFPSRQDFVVAVATRTAQELAATMRSAAEAAGDDPVEAIAAAAEAYVRFAVTRRAGFDLVYAQELRGIHDDELREAGRSISDIVLLRAIEATGGDNRAAVAVVPQFMVVAHGAATMNSVGVFSDLDAAATLAAKTVRRLLRSGATEA
jgi:AcrR family transcriptional regulator